VPLELRKQERTDLLEIAFLERLEIKQSCAGKAQEVIAVSLRIALC
jgi:hypothetical protein